MKKSRVWQMAAVLAAVICTVIIALGRQGTPVPVLMYHHFIEEGPSAADTVVSARRFEEQMRALRDAGYTAVTPDQLRDYVDRRGSLPARPILITMDDGYTSNLAIAAPVLQKYGMRATIFVIGLHVGRTTYPNSDELLDPPRFGWTEAEPWVKNGVLTIQSHTYDMHHWPGEEEGARQGVLPEEGEPEADYRAALERDVSMFREELYQGTGTQLTALAYPYGLYSEQSEQVLEEQGVAVTFTTRFGCRRVSPGRKDCLRLMERWGVDDKLTGPQLLSGLKKLERRAWTPLF